MLTNTLQKNFKPGLRKTDLTLRKCGYRQTCSIVVFLKVHRSTSKYLKEVSQRSTSKYLKEVSKRSTSKKYLKEVPQRSISKKYLKEVPQKTADKLAALWCHRPAGVSLRVSLLPKPVLRKN